MKINQIDILILTDIKDFLVTTRQKTFEALPDIVPDDVKNHILSYSLDINHFMENDFVKRYANKKHNPIVMSHIMKKLPFISMATTIAMNFHACAFFDTQLIIVAPYELIKFYVFRKAYFYMTDDDWYPGGETMIINACGFEDTTLEEQDI